MVNIWVAMLKYLLMALCVILVGTVFFTVGRTSALNLKKKLVILLSGSVFGIGGLLLMYLIEAGEFGGMSFFGAHFAGPLGIIFACAILKTTKEEMTDMLDISAPALCACLVALKIHCRIIGCCQGIALETDTNGAILRRFPSQTAEALFALLLMILLIIIIRRGKHRGTVFLLYMIFYGLGRYILNLFRETTPWILNMAAGNFWALLSLLIGATALYLRHLHIAAEEEKKQIRSKIHAGRRHR